MLQFARNFAGMLMKQKRYGEAERVFLQVPFYSTLLYSTLLPYLLLCSALHGIALRFDVLFCALYCILLCCSVLFCCQCHCSGVKWFRVTFWINLLFLQWLLYPINASSSHVLTSYSGMKYVIWNMKYHVQILDCCSQNTDRLREYGMTALSTGNLYKTIEDYSSAVEMFGVAVKTFTEVQYIIVTY